MTLRLLFALATVLALLACASSKPGQSFDKRSDLVYLHTREHLASLSVGHLEKRHGPLAEADMQAYRFVTEWDTALDPRATFGRRQRLTVHLEGPDGEVRVRVVHEVEMNTEKVQTLQEKEAKWEPVDADGAPAMVFLQLLSFDKLKTKPAPPEPVAP